MKVHFSVCHIHVTYRDVSQVRLYLLLKAILHPEELIINSALAPFNNYDYDYDRVVTNVLVTTQQIHLQAL